MVIEIGNNKALTVIRPSTVSDVPDLTKDNTEWSLPSKRQGKLIFPKRKEPDSLSIWQKGYFVDYYT